MKMSHPELEGEVIEVTEDQFQVWKKVGWQEVKETKHTARRQSKDDEKEEE